MSSLLNRNGRPLNGKPRGAQTHNITRDECQTLIDRAVKAAVEDTTIKVCEFYLAQVPKLVVNMCNEVFKQHGIEAAITLNAPTDVVPGEAGDIQ